MFSTKSTQNLRLESYNLLGDFPFLRTLLWLLHEIPVPTHTKVVSPSLEDFLNEYTV